MTFVPTRRGSAAVGSREGAEVGRLIRLDRTGHTTLAEWAAGDEVATAQAAEALRLELERGYIASAVTGDGAAEVVRELPEAAELVTLRRTIVGG
jgi:hypothetical protein